MPIAQTDQHSSRKPLRLWPGVVIVLLQWFVRFAVPTIDPDAMPFGVIGGLISGAAVAV